jgi:hypothetical protein
VYDSPCFAVEMMDNNFISVTASTLKTTLNFISISTQAISQGDKGLGKIGRSHPNILVMSAGGYGHIPIPLVKSEIKAVAMDADSDGGVLEKSSKHKYDIGFFGSVGPMQALRNEPLKIIGEEAQRLGLTYHQV